MKNSCGALEAVACGVVHRCVCVQDWLGGDGEEQSWWTSMGYKYSVGVLYGPQQGHQALSISLQTLSENHPKSILAGTMPHVAHAQFKIEDPYCVTN